MVKIAFIDEYEKWMKSLSVKEDTLLILYYKGSDNVPLSLLQSINSAKCKLEFVEIEDIFPDKKLNLSYSLGVLKERFKTVKPLSDNDYICKVFGASKATTKPSGSKRTVSPKPTVANSTPISKEPVVSDVKTAVKRGRKPSVEKTAKEPQITAEPNNSQLLVVSEPKAEKKPKVSKTSTPKESVSSNKDVKSSSDAMSKLIDYCASFKTKQFDPSQYTSSIVNAVRQADKDKIPLDEALMYCCTPNVHKQIYEVFKGKEKELFKLALAVPR